MAEPVRLTKEIDIGERKFIVQELTVREILDLVSNSSFAKDLSKEEDNGIAAPESSKVNEQSAEEGASLSELNMFKEFSGIGGDLEAILKKSCKNFELKDLMDLTPSSIKKVIDGFKEVNQDFFVSLKALGIVDALKEVREAALTTFSRRLVTLSKLAT